jgi:predicted DNA-binding transcriptional regulator AlpA
MHEAIGVRDMERLLTPDEVAALLQKPVRTLGQWRYQKLGPRYLRTGREVRYRPEDVEAWVKEQAAQVAV